ncbi:unnamed protein product [Pleuronectes platessa]|uniref:Phosphatidic acid phosphatase type 2/haloperoxidase domain-containing protein n=1 Tax=Pleuronectes platessa TaxID=8262 RepID=A0A9N7TMQ7_PLEPL|nr:unnamed protein product [Pleuronectes platessa]
MKRSRRSVAWDHFELKNELVHCQHCEAIPEAGGDKEPALSDTDEGSANTGAAARLAKLAQSYLCITATSVPSERITITETVLFLVQYTSKEFDRSEKTVATGDCCYLNPLVRRTFRFLGVYTFGLFTVDIFVNAGQVVTGNLAPYFLTICKPNYTALGCQQAMRYISHQEACTGNQDDILRARKTFPSKEAALSVYAALYLAMYVTCTVQAKGTRLAKPVLSLGLMCLAFLTGLNRVAEYRNHWSDVIAGFIIGTAIAAFLLALPSSTGGASKVLLALAEDNTLWLGDSMTQGSYDRQSTQRETRTDPGLGEGFRE